MKPILIALSLAAAAVAALSAREISVTCDPVPTADEIHIWLETPDGPQRIGTIPAADIAAGITVELPDEVATLTATASNEFGESAHSEPLVIGMPPAAPEGLRMKVTIQLETSENLTDWREVASISFPEQAAPKQFFRLK